nr:unnamed protein product [Callosobruchus analis]
MCYGILSWGRASYSHIQKVFLAQKAAIGAITKAKCTEHCQPIFKKLVVMTVYVVIIYENLRCRQRHKQTFTSCFEVHNHNKRQKHKLIHITIETPRERLSRVFLSNGQLP